MKIQSLEIANFGAVQKACLNLEDQGLVLIQGENSDDSSAMSNGAGKSTIPDALCWALYGVTARGDSGDKVVNRTAGKDCYVAVAMSDGKHSWHIRRNRKHSTEKNRVVVTQMDLALGTITDLTQGTDKATQEIIEKVLGCGPDVFMASIYAGQEAMPNLPGMTDKQLKELIEQAAGIDRLQAAYDQARVELQQATRTFEKLGIEKSSKLIELAKEKDNRAFAREQKSKFENEMVDKIAAKINEVNDLKKMVGDLDDKLAAGPDLKMLVAQRAEIVAKLSSFEADRAAVVALDRLASEELVKLTKLNSVLGVHAAAARKTREECDNVELAMSKPCSECGKPHTPEERDDLRKHLDERLKKEIETVRELKARAESQKLAQETAQKEADKARSELKDTSALTKEHGMISNLIDSQNKVVQEREALLKRIAAANGQITDFRDTPNPHDESIKRAEREIDRVEKGVVELDGKIDKAEVAVMVTKSVVEVFGPAGVRAHILDTVTPFLNTKTAEYLNALSDGNLSAVWTTLGKTAKGEVREKFNIEVASTTAGESFSSLSGGEKRKVRLACAMALQDLVSSRATKPIDLFIGDEIDHALDPAGLERLMGVLEQKARERGTVLVISHGDLTDWIREVMVVTKKGGYSTVSGALVI